MKYVEIRGVRWPLDTRIDRQSVLGTMLADETMGEELPVYDDDTDPPQRIDVIRVAR